MFNFTFDNIREEYKKAIKAGYKILTCEEYLLNKGKLNEKILVNRIDIDYSIKKSEILKNIFDELGIKATFFVRLHAPEYNPFSFENYRILKSIRDSGHEIGYHSEIVDQSKIWNEPVKECLLRDIELLERMLDIKISGVASHGGNTQYNNLDFWSTNKPKDFNLMYEAYDQEDFDLFFNSFYISDSEWTKWKCYSNGKLIDNDKRSLSEHLLDDHKLIYLLIHPDTYYWDHIYE